MSAFTQLPRRLLIPPIFLVTVICLWLTSAFFPYSVLQICVAGRRTGLRCFPKQSSAFSLSIHDVSVERSEVMLKPQPLHSAARWQGEAIPSKPLIEIETWEADDLPLETASTHTAVDFGFKISRDHESRKILRPHKQEEQTLDQILLDFESGEHEEALVRISEEQLHGEADVTSKILDTDAHKTHLEDLDSVHASTNKLYDLNRSTVNESQEDFGTSDLDQQPEVLVNSAEKINNETGIRRDITSEAGADDKLDRSPGRKGERRQDKRNSFSAGANTVVENSTDHAEKAGVDAAIIGATATEKNDAEKYVSAQIEDVRRTAVPRNGARSDEAWRLTKLSANASACAGRRVYVYDLPSKFNADLLLGCHDMMPSFDMCKFVINDGMGESFSAPGDVLVPTGSWYWTHQYALEMLFHARVKEYSCRTWDAEEANVFYVPFYGGLDVVRWHFRQNVSNEQRDELSKELLGWLEGRPWWRRNGGADHVLVLGKISWDFRRQEGTTWGSKLLDWPETQAMTKLLIERHPFHSNDIGIPHPTFFHPTSDLDVKIWQHKIHSSPRTHLVSFAGKPRMNSPTSIRAVLIQQCLNRSDACFFLECHKDKCQGPEKLMASFASSEFCLQPPGDSATRRSVFDSLIAGCIPVIFDPYSAYYQYPWHLPAEGREYSVLVGEKEVGKVVEILEAIPATERARMRRRIIEEVMPGLVYAAPGAKLQRFDDAFDVALNSVLWRIANSLSL